MVIAIHMGRGGVNTKERTRRPIDAAVVWLCHPQQLGGGEGSVGRG